jgi:hypothetical protein
LHELKAKQMNEHEFREKGKIDIQSTIFELSFNAHFPLLAIKDHEDAIKRHKDAIAGLANKSK